MAAAAAAAGRDVRDITLVAVSKEQPWDAIAPVLGAGQRVFGENRVGDAIKRWDRVRPVHPDIRLHLIGPLQSNKALEAVSFFDVIETVDRPSLAAALRAAIDKTGRSPALYMQVNTGAEPQKSGVPVAALAERLDSTRTVHGLQISGLMCIPPVSADPRPHFELLAKLARQHGLAQVSMGMSADFEAAIAAGATTIRVGSALFGARPHPTPRDRP